MILEQGGFVSTNDRLPSVKVNAAGTRYVARVARWSHPQNYKAPTHMQLQR